MNNKKVFGYEYLKIYYWAQVSEKILLWTIFRKSVNDSLASCNNMKKISEAEFLLFFLSTREN